MDRQRQTARNPRQTGGGDGRVSRPEYPRQPVAAKTGRVLGIGDDLQVHWKEIAGQAKTIVGLECIGADRIPQQTLLRPNRAVKSTTLFLRYCLDVRPSFPNCRNDPNFCHSSKVSICQPINVEPWGRTEMAALLRLVYQVRCNLFHGEKQLSVPDTQTNHDRQLVSVSTEILNSVFGRLC